MPNFQINALDHVAIRVADLDASAAWYEKTLGLKKYQLEKWGDFPIFLLAGKTGIALFPTTQTTENEPPKDIIVDHFAFNVTQDNFAKARAEFDVLGIAYQFKNHHYFHSIYLKDPDGHTVELTTIVVDEASFY